MFPRTVKLLKVGLFPLSSMEMTPLNELFWSVTLAFTPEKATGLPLLRPSTPTGFANMLFSIVMPEIGPLFPCRKMS